MIQVQFVCIISKVVDLMMDGKIIKNEIVCQLRHKAFDNFWKWLKKMPNYPS
jgi:hypothetical protein